MQVKQQILAKLLKIGAIQLRPQQPFVWASGMHSPIYCDNRLSLSFPEIRKLIVDGFVQLIEDMDKPDIIVGVATAGIAHGALVANALDLPFAYVRSKKKSHGRQNAIEGLVSSGQRCMVIEDLISTGGSSIAAAQLLVDENLEIIQILSIFNYNLSAAKDNFANAEMNYSSICDYNLLLEVARQDSSFSTADIALLAKWSEDPKQWSINYKQEHKIN